MKTKLTKENLRVEEQVPEGGVVGVRKEVVAVELYGHEHILNPRLEESLGGGGVRCQDGEDQKHLAPHVGERRIDIFVMA